MHKSKCTVWPRCTTRRLVLDLKRRFTDTQVATVQAIRGQEKLSAWDFFYALDMANRMPHQLTKSQHCLLVFWFLEFGFSSC